MKSIFSIIALALALVSCSNNIHKELSRKIQQTENSFKDHTGFALYDVQKNESIYEYQSDKYFTPASNTKILTLFASLTILGDSLPALKYVESNDSLIFWGMGDPSFLNKYVFTNNRVFNFLRDSTKPLYFSAANFHTDRFGAGWAWDDYQGSYQAERSAFPIYNNMVTGTLQQTELIIEPARFIPRVVVSRGIEQSELVRALHTNNFNFYPPRKTESKKFEIPFIVYDSLINTLLEDTLRREIVYVDNALASNAKVLFATPADSVYRVMMQESDNFLAEQLLLQCSATLSDSLKPEIAIDFMQQNHLINLPDKIIWVDGSGLSRYNLFTPRSIVEVWKKLYEKIPTQRLLPMLATGGVNGTVRNWYKHDKPYIFGKTGTLANNHSLSGYLITKTGKTLIFSFMNSNYLVSTADIRSNMQQIFEYIRDNYK
jgi:serine-type D-Ala-D-Ala carboxypeptidase/endopeptidase (penicillin-binding protein 4)